MLQALGNNLKKKNEAALDRNRKDSEEQDKLQGRPSLVFFRIIFRLE